MSKFWKLLLALGLVYFSLYLPGLDRIPRVLYDEAAYANTAYTFAQTGHFKNTIGGFSGQQLFVYPLLLGTSLLGQLPTLWLTRFFSVLCGFLSLLMLLKIGKKWTLSLPILGLVGSSFMVMNTNYVAFRIVRPEGLEILLALGVVYLAMLVLEAPSRGRYLALGCCGAALGGTHFIGALIALGVGGAIAWPLMKQKDWPSLKFLILGGFPITLFFIINLGLVGESVSAEATQILSTSKKFNFNLFHWETFWINLTQLGIDKYMMGWKRALIVVFELGILALGLAHRKRDKWTAILSWTTLFYLVFGFFSVRFFIRSYFSLLPVLTLLIWCRLYLTSKTTTFTKVLIISLIGISTYHALGTGYFFHQNRDNVSYARIAAAISPFVQPGSTVIAHKEFWFSVPHTKTWKTPEFIKSNQWPKELTNKKNVVIINSNFKNKSASVTGQDAAIFKPGRDTQMYQSLKTFGEQNAQKSIYETISNFGEITLYKF